VRQLVNPVGAVTLARSYEPFGKLLSTAGNPLTKYGYTGEWTDPTNLVYLRARYYDPATGRFLSKDPVRGLPSLPQTLNPYTYAVNNPIRYTDPSGEYIETLIDIGFIGFDIYTLINHWNTGCGNISSDLLALGLDVVGAVLPFATGLGMVARFGSKADDVVRIGQFHHILSNKIMRALSKHGTLKSILGRNDFIVRAADLPSHYGYQKWHILVDNDAIKWLKDNPNATREQFINFLREIYSRPEMRTAFPDALDILK